jgi:hypothetical protein
MELFIPSLTLLLAAVALAYFWLPQFAPPMLIGGSAIVLAVAVYIHVNQFGRAEYEKATWYHNLRNYSAWVVIGAILLGAYGFYAMNQSSPAAATAPMPPMVAPAVGGGLGSVMQTASSRINELMRRGRISTN